MLSTSMTIYQVDWLFLLARHSANPFHTNSQTANSNITVSKLWEMTYW